MKKNSNDYNNSEESQKENKGKLLFQFEEGMTAESLKNYLSTIEYLISAIFAGKEIKKEIFVVDDKDNKTLSIDIYYFIDGVNVFSFKNFFVVKEEVDIDNLKYLKENEN